jgi:hypothetical protein
LVYRKVIYPYVVVSGSWKFCAYFIFFSFFFIVIKYCGLSLPSLNLLSLVWVKRWIWLYFMNARPDFGFKCAWIFVTSVDLWTFYVYFFAILFRVLLLNQTRSKYIYAYNRGQKRRKEDLDLSPFYYYWVSGWMIKAWNIPFFAQNLILTSLPLHLFTWYC